jgi:hypothetical protein
LVSRIAAGGSAASAARNAARSASYVIIDLAGFRMKPAEFRFSEATVIY